MFAFSRHVAHTEKAPAKRRQPYEEDTVHTWSPSFEHKGQPARCSNLMLGAIGRMVLT
jgi:hypothetical protein